MVIQFSKSKKARAYREAGHKASIMLEELIEAYGGPHYVFQSINVMQKVQKESWYTDLAPNGQALL